MGYNMRGSGSAVWAGSGDKEEGCDNSGRGWCVFDD